MLGLQLSSSMLLLTATIVLLCHVGISSMAASVQEQDAEREKCIEEVETNYFSANLHIRTLVDPLLHQRLLEARKYYTDETVDVPQPPALSSCQQIHSQITKAQSLDFGCAGEYEPKAFFAELYARSEHAREVAEYGFVCDYGKMTGHYLRESGLFQLFANPERLNKLEQFEKERVRCWKLVGELIAEKVPVERELRDLAKAARKFYSKSWKLDREDFPDIPESCQVFLDKIQEVDGNSECATMPEMPRLDVYYLAVLGEPVRDWMEAQVTCAYGQGMPDFMSRMMVNHLFDNPRRARWLEEQEKLERSSESA